jgi:hypothetical protein
MVFCYGSPPRLIQGPSDDSPEGGKKRESNRGKKRLYWARKTKIKNTVIPLVNSYTSEIKINAEKVLLTNIH